MRGRLRAERPVLCLVTDRLRLPDRGGSPIDAVVRQVTEAVAAGVTLIQIRERDLDAADLLALAVRCVDVANGSQSLVVVNDRIDVALAAGAAGVHLRGDSVAVGRVRAIVPGDFVIGRSIHTAEEAMSVAEAGGVDYMIFGTVFPTAAKPAGHVWAGVERLRRVASSVDVPVLAIGGLTPETIAAVAATPAAGFAAVSYFQPRQGDAAGRSIEHAAQTARVIFQDTPVRSEAPALEGATAWM